MFIFNYFDFSSGGFIYYLLAYFYLNILLFFFSYLILISFLLNKLCTIVINKYKAFAFFFPLKESICFLKLVYSLFGLISALSTVSFSSGTKALALSNNSVNSPF